jgi:pantetheine-phosphate adenylyltransferase
VLCQTLISPDIRDAEFSLAAGAGFMTLAVYPGSFDPITNGHISILRRGLQVFDSIILAIAHNPQKKSLFSVEERIEMIRMSLPGEENFEVDTFDGLLVDYAQRRGANVILRGLRALSDFEYEFQMALMNRRLNRDIQSIFLMTDYKWFYISSTIVKEAAMFGGDISGLVPDYVCRKLKEKYGRLKKA